MALKRIIKLYLALVISILPLSRIRVFLYRVLLRYKISPKAKIGFGTLIAVDKVQIGKAKIQRFNKFKGPYELIIADKSTIGNKNKFECGDWVASKAYSEKKYLRSCIIGQKALITVSHYFDVTGGVK